jgi:hypothetical protein
MMIDTTVIARRLLQIAPRWALWTIMGSAVTGEFLRVIWPSLGLVPHLTKLPPQEWTVIGMVLCFPPTWIWRAVTKSQNPYAHAADYIKVLNEAMQLAELTKAEQKFQWRAVFSKLSDSFKLDAAPPSPQEVAAAVSQDLGPTPT